MYRHSTIAWAGGVVAAALVTGVAVSRAASVEHQQARLVARSILPAAAYRSGSPPSGAFFSASERASAAPA